MVDSEPMIWPDMPETVPAPDRDDAPPRSLRWLHEIFRSIREAWDHPKETEK